MIRTNVLKGKMVEMGYSSQKMASELRITPQTFYSKMRKGVFDSDEISKMVELLQISDIEGIFFAKSVAEQGTFNEEQEAT